MHQFYKIKNGAYHSATRLETYYLYQNLSSVIRILLKGCFKDDVSFCVSTNLGHSERHSYLFLTYVLIRYSKLPNRHKINHRRNVL